MNILKYECKRQIKNLIVWTFFILLLLYTYVLGFYPIFEDSMSDMQKMVANFPPSFAKAFGIELESFFHFFGFYSFLFQYVALLGSIMATFFTVSIFGSETKNHCQDFLFSKPVKRSHIFIYKLLSVLSLLILSNIFYVASAIFLFLKYDTKEHIVLASLSLFFLELVFMCIGIFYTILAKKIRSIAGIASAVGFIAFILSALSKLLDEKIVYYLSPFSFFEPRDLWMYGHFKESYVFWAVLCSIALLCGSYFIYCKKDSKSM